MGFLIRCSVAPKGEVSLAAVVEKGVSSISGSFKSTLHEGLLSKGYMYLIILW